MLALTNAIPTMAADFSVAPSLQVDFVENVDYNLFGSASETVEDGLSVRVPAIPVTGVWGHSIQILPNGRVQLVMLVAGQGSFINHWSTMNSQSSLVSVTAAAGIAPITHFFHTFDLGVARGGQHWFDFTVRCLRTGNMVSNSLGFSIQ